MTEDVKNAIKGVPKSKFMWLSFLLAVTTPVLENLPALKEMLAENYGWALFTLSTLVAGLRAMTTTSLKEK